MPLSHSRPMVAIPLVVAVLFMSCPPTFACHRNDLQNVSNLTGQNVNAEAIPEYQNWHPHNRRRGRRGQYQVANLHQNRGQAVNSQYEHHPFRNVGNQPLIQEYDWPGKSTATDARLASNRLQGSMQGSMQGSVQGSMQGSVQPSMQRSSMQESMQGSREDSRLADDGDDPTSYLREVRGTVVRK
jgi:hypothetical protein